MIFGELFAGISGIGLGLERAGMRPAWHVEIDSFCRAVLAKHWPHVPRYPDVYFTGAANLAPVDLIAGGFPCQDLSVAGKKAGLERGHRSGLWREFRRIVSELRPRFVLVENVAHTWRQWVPVVRSDLGSLGYASLPIRLRASDFGAPHERARCFIVAAAHAHSAVLRDEQRWCLGPRRGARASVSPDARSSRQASDVDGVSERESHDEAHAQRGSGDARSALARRGDSAPDADGEGQLQQGGAEPDIGRWPRNCGWWATEPDVARVVHGLSDRVDGRARRAREAALGNAVVPQAAEWIGRGLIEALTEVAA